MAKGGDIASAIGGGMQAFGSLETARRGGGRDTSRNLGLEALAERSQKKVEKGAAEAGGQAAGGLLGGMSEDDYPQKKKGGRISRTGIYKLHKGEYVIPADKVKRLEKRRKAGRKSGRR